MANNKWIQAAKLGYIVISVLLCVLGIVLIVAPDFSVSLLCWIGGLLLILFGIVKIIGYYSRDLYRLAFQHDLAFGILMMALGVILIVRSDIVMNVFCIFLGICILADALLKIQTAMDARTFGIRRWWLIFTVAVLTGAVGFLLVLRPSESARAIAVLLGAALIFEGLLNLITILTAVRILRNQKPMIIDTE